MKWKGSTSRALADARLLFIIFRRENLRRRSIHVHEKVRVDAEKSSSVFVSMGRAAWGNLTFKICPSLSRTRGYCVMGSRRFCYFWDAVKSIRAYYFRPMNFLVKTSSFLFFSLFYLKLLCRSCMSVEEITSRKVITDYERICLFEWKNFFLWNRRWVARFIRLDDIGVSISSNDITFFPIFFIFSLLGLDNLEKKNNKDLKNWSIEKKNDSVAKNCANVDFGQSRECAGVKEENNSLYAVVVRTLRLNRSDE